MRVVLIVAATALAASAIGSTSLYAQTKKTPTAAQTTDNPGAARASLNESYNKCVSLARSRGYTESDLDGNRAAARNFVIRCMQGKQR